MSRGRCDQCQVLMINGVACHETGCLNSWLNPVTGKAYPVRCRECDRSFTPDEKYQKMCRRCARVESV